MGGGVVFKSILKYKPPRAIMESGRIISGVFAVNKPIGPTSADVIRDIQAKFRPSKLFAPWLVREQALRDASAKTKKRHWRKWHDRQAVQVKIGHGGTLDPAAKGVLILGVGDGTKALSNFIHCSKSYECVVLFGAATDTYDAVGRVVSQRPFEHVTREKVEAALEQFRGDIMQRPPIYSALWVKGKRMYEYAREGKELPVEIQEREMHVHNLEIVEWYDGGSHKFQWPIVEVPKEEVKAVEDLIEQTVGSTQAEQRQRQTGSPAGSKRKRDVDSVTSADFSEISKRPRSTSPEATPVDVGNLPTTVEGSGSTPIPAAANASESTRSCPAPACRIRMTVTSGFYVRSFCHDLGAAVDSAALMAALTRTRQGDFELGKNVLELDELAEDEAVWGSKVERLLDEWTEKESHGVGSSSGGGGRHSTKASVGRSKQRRQERRNTSSPEV